jgi:two-component system nitrate/nitrite response regulator NarL
MSKVILFGRHEVLVTGVKTVLQAAGHVVVAACFSGNDDLDELLDAHHPDLVALIAAAGEPIFDSSGPAFLAPVRRARPTIRLIVLLEEPRTLDAAELSSAAIDGLVILNSSASKIIDCIDAVERGRRWLDPEVLPLLALNQRAGSNERALTAREEAILERVARGLRNKQIAREMNLSEGTVKMHVHHILQKLHLQTRTQLAFVVLSGSKSPKETRKQSRLGAPNNVDINIEQAGLDIEKTFWVWLLIEPSLTYIATSAI